MKVLIAAGGTAGHINPALAIAGALKKADPTAEIHFAGRKEGMEYRLVTQAGYPFHHIEITGFQRKLSLNNIRRNIITLWNLALSGPTAKKMMKEIPRPGRGGADRRRPGPGNAALPDLWATFPPRWPDTVLLCGLFRYCPAKTEAGLYA